MLTLNSDLEVRDPPGDDLSTTHYGRDIFANEEDFYFDARDVDLADTTDDFNNLLMRDMLDDPKTAIIQRGLQNEISHLELILRDLHTRGSPKPASPKGGSRSPSPVKSIDLQVVPYDRGTYAVSGKKKPCHWAIFAHTGPGQSGTAYQLKGMPGAFRYDGPEKGITPSHSSRARQEVDIGRIPSDKVRDMEAIIASVPISKSESGYNCQTWTENVLTAMQPHGWLDLAPSAVSQWLKGMEA